MSVTEKFMDDSARAAIRALRGLEQTAIMLETYAPDIFPETNEVNGVVQKHFGRVMMESAAQSIRDSWSSAIKEVENKDRAKTEDIALGLFNALRDMTEFWAYGLKKPAGATPSQQDHERVEKVAGQAFDALLAFDPTYASELLVLAQKIRTPA